MENENSIHNSDKLSQTSHSLHESDMSVHTSQIQMEPDHDVINSEENYKSKRNSIGEADQEEIDPVNIEETVENLEIEDDQEENSFQFSKKREIVITDRHNSDIKIENLSNNRDLSFEVKQRESNTLKDETSKEINITNPFIKQDLNKNQNEEYSQRQDNDDVEEIIEELDRSEKGLKNLDLILFDSEKLCCLKKVNYSNNEIKIIDKSVLFLSSTALFDLSFNQITKIQNLENLKYLMYLNLSNNFISVVEGLNHLSLLEVLDLSHNKILLCDVVFRILKFNVNLKSIGLEGNINYEFDNIRVKVLENLHNVCYLDNVEIHSPESQIKAKKPCNFKIFYGNRQSQPSQNLRNIKDYIKYKRFVYSQNK